jgi:uncharacterized protein (DUF1697 family)
MTRYVALLRGIGPINPNMRGEKLRGLFEDLGFTNVRTVLASGNVLFDSPSADSAALEAQIEAALPEHLGFSSTTIIRSQAELQGLLDQDPFGGIEHAPKTNLNLTFLKTPTTIKFTTPYTPEGRTYTIVAQTNRELGSIIDLTGAKTPDLMTWLERQFGRAITTRTHKTVQRILAKMTEK